MAMAVTLAVCQSARHHCGGKPIRFHTVQFPSNGSRGQVMEQIAESVRQQAAGDDFAAKSSLLHYIDRTFDHTNLNARAPWSFLEKQKLRTGEASVQHAVLCRQLYRHACLIKGDLYSRSLWYATTARPPNSHKNHPVYTCDGRHVFRFKLSGLERGESGQVVLVDPN